MRPFADDPFRDQAVDEDPFGDRPARPLGGPPPLRLVDLADEYHLTTAQALDVCRRARVPASDGGSVISPEQAEQFRQAAAQADPATEVPPVAAGWAVPNRSLPGSGPSGADLPPLHHEPFVPISPYGAPTAPAGPTPGRPPGSGPAPGPVPGQVPGRNGYQPPPFTGAPFTPAFGPDTGPPPWDPAPPGPSGTPAGYGTMGHSLPGAAPMGYGPVGPARLEPLVLVALALAFLPVVAMAFGFVGGILLILPALLVARSARKKIGARPAELKGLGLARAAELVAVGGMIAGWLFFVLVSSGAVKKTPTQAVTDAVAGQDTTAYRDLTVGTCIRTDVVSSGAPQTARGVPKVDCGGPHDGEVFLTTSSSSPAYPGEVGMKAEAVRTCIPAFLAYTGSDPATTTLDFGAFFPLESTWAAGDRTIVCFAYDPTLVPLVGSVKGSGR